MKKKSSTPKRTKTSTPKPPTQAELEAQAQRDRAAYEANRLAHRAKYEQRYPAIDPVRDQLVIQGMLQDESVDGKRFSLPGITFEAQCPTCKFNISRMGGDYLHSPSFGVPIDMKLWCETCYMRDEVGYEGHRLTVRLELRVVPVISMKGKK